MIQEVVYGKIMKHCYTAKSEIHGKGVFAGQIIRKRSKIGSLSGKIVTIASLPTKFKSNESIAIVELTGLLALDAREFRNELCFVNHSCRPNCFMRVYKLTIEVYCLRTIKKGTELTLDYGDTHHEGKLRCECKCHNCKGFL